jgi:hypothetical protein
MPSIEVSWMKPSITEYNDNIKTIGTPTHSSIVAVVNLFPLTVGVIKPPVKIISTKHKTGFKNSKIVLIFKESHGTISHVSVEVAGHGIFRGS